MPAGVILATPTRRLFEGYQAPPVTAAWTGWVKRRLLLRRPIVRAVEREQRQTTAWRKWWIGQHPEAGQASAYIRSLYYRPLTLAYFYRELTWWGATYLRSRPDLRAHSLIECAEPARPDGVWTDVWLEKDEWHLIDWTRKEASRFRKLHGRSGLGQETLAECCILLGVARTRQYRHEHGLDRFNVIP